MVMIFVTVFLAQVLIVTSYTISSAKSCGTNYKCSNSVLLSTGGLAGNDIFECCDACFVANSNNKYCDRYIIGSGACYCATTCGSLEPANYYSSWAINSNTCAAKATASPSKAPTASPTTIAPSANPTINPTATPSATPTMIPTAPTADPTVAPTASPSIDPTVQPSVNPTVAPTAPTVDPSAAPSANPTVAPTASPSIDPTVQPSVNPTVAPTASPSFDPTVQPSANPTVTPTASPSIDPTVQPSANPTVTPTASPSINPTVLPTASPSVDPTTGPSALPTAKPTCTPTHTPTLAPSMAPTVRPTLESQQNFVLFLHIQQTVYFMTPVDYGAQPVEYNRTIQHTVARSLGGVMPQDVTKIVVSDSPTHTLSEPSVELKYVVAVRDPLLSFTALRAELIDSVQNKQMDNYLHSYAAQFGISNLANGTFSEPEMRTLDDGGASSSWTGAQIAGLLIGIVMGAALVTVCLLFVFRRRESDEDDKCVEPLPDAAQASLEVEVAEV